MFRMQASERMTFNYPPFSRMVKISIKHKDRTQLNYFSEILGRDLKNIFGKRVLGPESPVISQVQLWYIKTIIIKIEREKPPAKAKQFIIEAIERLEKEKGASSLRIAIGGDTGPNTRMSIGELISALCLFASFLPSTAAPAAASLREPIPMRRRSTAPRPAWIALSAAAAVLTAMLAVKIVPPPASDTMPCLNKINQSRL